MALTARPQPIQNPNNPIAPAIANAGADIGAGIGEALREFVKTKQESKFLDATFETLVKSRSKLGMPVDPDIIKKFSGSSVSAKRGFVSGMAAEMDFAEKSAQLQKQQAEMERGARNLQFFNAVTSAPQDDPNKFNESYGSALKQFQPDPEFASEIYGKLKPAKPAPSQISVLQTEREAAMASGNTKRAEEIDAAIKKQTTDKEPSTEQERAIDTLLKAGDITPEQAVDMRKAMAAGNAGIVFETQNPDGTVTRVQVGGKGKAQDPGALTQPVITKLQTALTSMDSLANSLKQLNSSFSGTRDAGISKMIGRFVDEGLEQVFPGVGNPERMKYIAQLQNAITKVMQSGEGLGALNESEKKALVAQLPTTDDWLESPAQASTKLKVFWDDMRFRAKNMASKLGVPPPAWAMEPAELMERKDIPKEQKLEQLKQWFPEIYNRMIQLQQKEAVVPRNTQLQAPSLPPPVP